VRVRNASRVLLIGLSIALLAPASTLALGGFLDSLLGTHVEAGASFVLHALGVSNDSPLDVRRVWFAGIFIGAPLLACAICATAIPVSRRRQALPVAGLAIVSAAIAVLGIVRSFN